MSCTSSSMQRHLILEGLHFRLCVSQLPMKPRMMQSRVDLPSQCSLRTRKNGFSLHKDAFRDAIALRYGWGPTGILNVCVCGKAHGVEHALSCCRGGHVIKRHNKIRNVTATLLQEVTHNVRTEPILQPLTGEVLRGRCANTEDAGKVDVKCTGFWNVHQDAFLDVRVFNPLASSNRNKPIKTVYQYHEKERRRVYDQ